jgi:hypothetical protein
MTTRPTSLCLPRDAAHPAPRRGLTRSALDLALVALAFGFVAALTVAGHGPRPAPAAMTASVSPG